MGIESFLQTVLTTPTGSAYLAVLIVCAAGGVYLWHLRRMPRLDWPPVLQTPYRHISHRGASAYAPENTLEAFRIAIEDYQTDVLETDVHATADGQVVMIHDPTVDRTTNGAGAVRDMTYDEIRSLDAGYHFTRDDGVSYPYRMQGVIIPTLQEVLETFPHIKINVDVKQSTPAIESLVIDVIQRCHATNRVFVGSATKRVLRNIKILSSDIATFNCHRAVRRFLIYHWLGLHRLYRPTDYALQVLTETRFLKVVTPKSIAFAHRKGLVVHVWTINEEAEMLRLLRLGVDGIMTNYPDRLRRALDTFDQQQRIWSTR